MQAKNLGHYFSFEIEVLDDKGEHRRFRANNFQVRGGGRARRAARRGPLRQARRRLGARAGGQNTTRVKDYICTMPMKLEAGWNQVQLNLADLTKCVPPPPPARRRGRARRRADQRVGVPARPRVLLAARRAHGTNYAETVRVTVHANCRVRRIYFADRPYGEEELPPEFKLFLPIQRH